MKNVVPLMNFSRGIMYLVQTTLSELLFALLKLSVFQA